MTGETDRLPVGYTIEQLRRLMAIEARSYARRAMRMRDEMERGLVDEAFDRSALMRGEERAARYCWAVVAALAWLDGRVDEGLRLRLAHVVQTVIARGEPYDHTLIEVEGLGDD